MIMMTEYGEDSFDLTDALPEAVVDYFDADDDEREEMYAAAADAMMRHFDREVMA